MERRKWPATPHYGHDAWLLGDDEHGRWLELRVGQPVYRGEEVLFHGTSGGVLLVPRGGSWMAWFFRHSDLDIYVDVVTDLVVTDEAITMVDLDLDVIRRRDGSVELLDEDEFAEHQVTLAYSRAMVEHAERVAADVLAAVRADAAPFARSTAEPWLRRGEV